MIYIRRPGKEPVTAPSFKLLVAREIMNAGRAGLTIGTLYANLEQNAIRLNLDQFLPIIKELQDEGLLCGEDHSTWPGYEKMTHFGIAWTAKRQEAYLAGDPDYLDIV